MIWPFKKISVENHLKGIKKIKVHGMFFSIKRIDVLDYCTGAKVCAAIYDTYQSGNKSEQISDASMKKVKEHYIDILMAGIVSPEFSRKEEEGKILIENLLTDWELATELYGEIMLHSYGKKNFKLHTSLAKSF